MLLAITGTSIKPYKPKDILLAKTLAHGNEKRNGSLDR